MRKQLLSFFPNPPRIQNIQPAPSREVGCCLNNHSENNRFAYVLVESKIPKKKEEEEEVGEEEAGGKR